METETAYSNQGVASKCDHEYFVMALAVAIEQTSNS